MHLAAAALARFPASTVASNSVRASGIDELGNYWIFKSYKCWVTIFHLDTFNEINWMTNLYFVIELEQCEHFY